MGEIVAIIALTAIIGGLIVERHFYAKEMNLRLADCIKAVMSRNIGEYLQATKKENPKEDTFVENDEVQLSEATDSEFNTFIKEQTK